MKPDDGVMTTTYLNEPDGPGWWVEYSLSEIGTSRWCNERVIELHEHPERRQGSILIEDGGGEFLPLTRGKYARLTLPPNPFAKDTNP